MESVALLPLAFFDIGGQELILIFIVILLFFGPKRLPELARAFAKAKAELNKASRDFNDEIERATQFPDNSSETKKLDSPEESIPPESSSSSDSSKPSSSE